MSQQAITHAAHLKTTNSLPAVIDKNKKLFLTYLAFLVVYTVFMLVPQPAEAILLRYHLSSLGLRLIYLTIIIMVALIWGAGFYGYAKLRDYAKLISRQNDGRHVEIMSRGIFLLAMWLPVSEVVSSVLNYAATKHPSLLGTFTIIDNYINLILPLGAFIFIGLAARGLSGIIKHNYSHRVSSLITLGVVYISVIYTHLIISTDNRSLVYHLSLWLILLTIIGPYVFMWFIGAIAAYELYSYQRLVSGVLYRRSWSMLSIGCAWLITTSMCFQYLTAIDRQFLDKLSIYWILVIIYSLLALLSVGFMLIALGTSRLQKIEEI